MLFGPRARRAGLASTSCRSKLTKGELADRIEAGDETIPLVVCEALGPLAVQLRNLDEAIARCDHASRRWPRRTKRRAG
jgi:hypothetical protein